MALFTAETGRKAAALSHALNSARFRPTVIPEPPVQPPLGADAFTARRLARVRVQLDLVDAAITLEASKRDADGQRLNWLASAQERLAEQEGWLANRAKPGSLRPTGPGKRGSTAGWATMDQVAPTLPSALAPPAAALPPPPAKPPGWEYDTPIGSGPTMPAETYPPK